MATKPSQKSSDQTKCNMVSMKDLHYNDGSYGLPKNPRIIRDERFTALCKSIRDNPEYMPARPIIIDERGVILGGNMRYRACVDIGMLEIPATWVQKVEGWSEEKKRRFIVLDNRGFGEDDVEALLASFDVQELLMAGMEEKDLQDQADALNDEIDKDNEEIFEQSIQLSPQDRFICIIVSAEEFEEAKQLLGLKMVRRGGYKEGSQFDATGWEKCIKWGRIKNAICNTK